MTDSDRRGSFEARPAEELQRAARMRRFMRLATGACLLLLLPTIYVCVAAIAVLPMGAHGNAFILSVLVVAFLVVSTFFVAPAYAWNAFDRGQSWRAAAWIFVPIIASAVLFAPIIAALIPD